MSVITLTAVQVPPFQLGGSGVTTIAQAYASPNGTAPASPNYSAGMTSLAKSGLNATSMRVDLATMDGGGLIRAINFGGFVMTTTGLTVGIGGGRAQLNGTVEYIGGTATLADNATNYLWFLQQTPTMSAITVVQSLTPPGNAAAYIGCIVTVAGAATKIDTSGVMYTGGGLRFRKTADAGPPTDAPATGTPPFLTCTSANGVYMWNPLSNAFDQWSAPTSYPFIVQQVDSTGALIGGEFTGTVLLTQDAPSLVSLAGGITGVKLTPVGISDPTT